jgi:hypothetical protein
MIPRSRFQKPFLFFFRRDKFPFSIIILHGDGELRPAKRLKARGAPDSLAWGISSALTPEVRAEDALGALKIFPACPFPADAHEVHPTKKPSNKRVPSPAL